jgi:hypothetical protein
MRNLAERVKLTQPARRVIAVGESPLGFSKSLKGQRIFYRTEYLLHTCSRYSCPKSDGIAP